ncbi:MAG: 1,4-dihydroxy-2-naphthoate octaprenyltransferase, partial [Acidimicrobiia bacterium]
AVAAVAGGLLAVYVDLRLLLVGLASFVAAVGYSGGPRPYASAGLGEVFVFVFFGLVATIGSSFVQDERIHQLAYVAAIPVGLLAVAILVVNNLRDIETDRAAGKMTLAVRMGAGRTRLLYQALVVISFLDLAALVAVTRSPMPLLALVAVPFAVRPVTTVLHSRDPRELIGALGGTARLQLVFSVLLAVGLWVIG